MAKIQELGTGKNLVQVQEMAFKFGNFTAGKLVFQGRLSGRPGRVVAVPVDKVDFQSDTLLVPVLFNGASSVSQIEWVEATELF